MNEEEIKIILSQVAIHFWGTPFASWFQNLYSTPHGSAGIDIGGSAGRVTVRGSMGGSAGGRPPYRVTGNKIIYYGKSVSSNENRDQPDRREKQYKVIITWERNLYKAILEKFLGNVSGSFPIIKGYFENFLQRPTLGNLSLIVICEPSRENTDQDVLDSIHVAIGGYNQEIYDRERYLASLYRAYVRCVTELHRESRPNSLSFAAGLLEIDDIFLPPEGDLDSAEFIPADVSVSWDTSVSSDVPYFAAAQRLDDLRWSVRILVALLLRQVDALNERATETDILRSINAAIAGNNVSQLAVQYLQLPSAILQGLIVLPNRNLPMEPLMSHPWTSTQV